MTTLGDNIRARREVMRMIADVARQAAQDWACDYTDAAKAWLQNWSQNYTDAAKAAVVQYVGEQIAASQAQAKTYVDNRDNALGARIDALTVRVVALEGGS